MARRTRLVRFLAPGFLLGLLAPLTLVSSAPANQGWTNNPHVTTVYDPDPYAMVPVAGGVVSVRLSGNQIQIDRINKFGKFPSSPQFLWSEVAGFTIDGTGEMAACSIGTRDLAIAYFATMGSARRLRVVQMKYVPSTKSFAVTAGPLTVGTGAPFGSRGLALTPNLIGSGQISGVWVAWWDIVGTGPSGATELRAQGVAGNALAFTGGASTNGALVTSSSLLGWASGTPILISDGLGQPILTHLQAPFTATTATATTKLKSDGTVDWSLPVPGQNTLSNGLVVARDGTGGAYYFFANRNTPQTDLVAARVLVDGTPYSTVFWSYAASSGLLRPLAAVATDDNGVVLAYRDEQLVAALKFGGATTPSLQWTNFLHGASGDNTDCAGGALGSESVALSWGREKELFAKGLNPATGAVVWPTVTINDSTQPSKGGNRPSRPEVFPAKLASPFDPGFLFCWHDEGIQERPEEGAFADRIDKNGKLGKWEGGEPFEGYGLGSVLNGQGGWKQWGGVPNSSSLIEDATSGYSLSGQSVSIDAYLGGDTSDLVQEFEGLDEGQYTITAQVYIPSGSVDPSYLLALNTYSDSGPFNWSVQLRMDPAAGLWTIDAGSPATAQGQLLLDQWVELRAEVDLDADLCEVFYNDELCAPAYSWTGGVLGTGGGALEIAAIDLSHAPATTTPSGKVYFDDINVVDVFETSAAVNYCTAGTSASGCQALISAAGTPTASATSGFSFVATGVEGQKDGLFFYGSNGRQANSWGNGTSFQCVVPPVIRAGLQVATGSIGQCDGLFSQDMSALWSAVPAKAPSVAAVVQAQLWYRDPANTSNQSTSLSNALEFTMLP